MIAPDDVRQLLETHSLGEGHRGFSTIEGHYYEGYYAVDETEEVIHFTAGGPLGGWEQDFPFFVIDLTTLTLPVAQEPQT